MVQKREFLHGAKEGNLYVHGANSAAFFADDLATAKMKAAKSFNSPVGTVLCMALSHKKNFKNFFRRF